jgi:hypothetical protein
MNDADVKWLELMKLTRFDEGWWGLMKVDEVWWRSMRLMVRFVTVLQKFPVNVLFAWLTQIFVVVSTVDLLKVFRFLKVLQKFPNKNLWRSLAQSPQWGYCSSFPFPCGYVSSKRYVPSCSVAVINHWSVLASPARPLFWVLYFVVFCSSLEWEAHA